MRFGSDTRRVLECGSIIIGGGSGSSIAAGRLRAGAVMGEPEYVHDALPNWDGLINGIRTPAAQARSITFTPEPAGLIAAGDAAAVSDWKDSAPGSVAFIMLGDMAGLEMEVEFSKSIEGGGGAAHRFQPFMAAAKAGKRGWRFK
ncbi:hypothetical protein OC845_000017 [Tilletia horrida]|nr:hypothetical protein OC845_000017 [Tilletia horrida]